MQTPTDASQGKIKVRLEILPEKQSFENRTLARAIANDIFEHLDQASDYSIEPHGTGEMSATTEFLILIALIGGPFVRPFTDKLAEKAAEKVVDLIGEILENIRRGKHSKLESDVKVQSLFSGDDVNTKGLLADALDKARTDLTNRAKHLEETAPDLNLPGMTKEIEVTISIKVSRGYP